MTFEIRTIHKMGGTQPTLWCLTCDSAVNVIYRNEWGFVDQWKRKHAEHCSPAPVAEPSPHYLVICQDEVNRHPDPFSTYAEASRWAEWGHLCTNGHSIERVTIHGPSAHIERINS
jgi:hypothetical protein